MPVSQQTNNLSEKAFEGQSLNDEDVKVFYFIWFWFISQNSISATETHNNNQELWERKNL